MKSRVFLLMLLAVAASAVAQAQIREGTVEISPFAGYLFGGEFARGTTSLFNVRVDVDDDVTYGARLGYNVTDNFEMEFQWSRTETAFVTNNHSGDLFGNNENKLGDRR